MQESTTGRANLLTFPLPLEAEIPTDTGCTNCGSSKLTTFEASSATGVRAPDGTAESVWEEGVHCLTCGANAAECESREWLAEAFQIVGGRSRALDEEGEDNQLKNVRDDGQDHRSSKARSRRDRDGVLSHVNLSQS